MKKPLIDQAQRWVLVFCLLFPLQRGAAQFVELTAEIAFDNWDYWFFCDKINKYPGRGNHPPSIFTTNYTVRCVVGTNTWLIERDTKNGKKMCWFTGTNIITTTAVTKGAPYTPQTRTYESSDGNPGRPVHVAELMTVGERISWLAFCSASFLKREGRQIFPPSDLWKQTISAPFGFSDQTTVFKDGLGLPRSLDLIATNNQPVFQYQIRHSTNVLSWNFPLEFYLVQYVGRTNGWQVQLTAKGKLTSIKEGTKPEIPAEVPEVQKAVEK